MKKVLCVLVMLAVIGCALFAKGTAEYPSQDINNLVVFGAGGGTDLANRLVMAEMGKILGVNINVNNVAGGVGGSIGMYEAYSKPADGYTLAGVSESCVTSAVQEGFNRRMNVWDFFIIGGSPGVISVNPSSPYQTIEDLVAAAKANPCGIRAGASSPGSIHHLNLLGFENGAGVKFNFIPYDGSAGSQNAAMTGEVTVVFTTVQEQAELLKAGRLRPLAMLTPDSFNFEGKEITSAFRPFPGLSQYLPLAQQVAFAIRKDAPADVKTKLQDAFKKAMTADSVKQFARERYFTLSGLVSNDANNIFDNLESVFSWTLWDLGAAKVDPSKIGIPRR